jgi:hypothetical protein
MTQLEDAFARACGWRDWDEMERLGQVVVISPDQSQDYERHGWDVTTVTGMDDDAAAR